MIDFSTNKYIHNTKIKHLHGTYIYEKEQIKLFSSNTLLIDKLNLKFNRKMLSQIGLIHLFCSPFFHEAGSSTTGLLQDFYFCLNFFTRAIYKQAISLSSWELYNPLVWVALQNPTHIILWNLQQLCQGNMCTSYFMSLLSLGRSRFIKK